MSAICGVLDITGAPVSKDDLEKMSMAARHRGPDGIQSWTSGSMGLTQILMATTPESNEETQPLRHPETGSVIVFDGRLDNRQELIAQLDPDGRQRRGNTDMELVLLAYLAWGKNCPARLLGDFSFAIYHAANQSLFCARDISSNKPFYYCFKAGKFVFGSTVSQLLAHPIVSDEINEAMVAELLTGLLISRTETLYRDIRRLPAAHYVAVDRNGVSVRPYWEPTCIKPIRYSTFADYSAHFEEIFADAVKCRLRSQGGVAITLSGGKDSPSVAGMAKTLLMREGDGKQLASYSLTYPGRPCDESALIADVVDKWDLDAHDCPFETFGEAPDWDGQVALTKDLPEFPTFTALTSAQRHSVSNGTRVWLSGTGSESISGGTDFPYLGLLREGNFAAIAREFSTQRRRSGMRFAGNHLVASLAWPMLPRSVRNRVQSRRHGMPTDGFATDVLVRSSRLEERFRSAQDAQQFDDLAHWSIHRSIFSGERAHLQESYDRLNSLNGIEERHPFEDRRLVEFAFAIPSHVKRDASTNKRLLLSLGDRLLPPSVQANQVKFEAGCLFLDMLCRESVRERLATARTAELGWVSKGRLLQVFDRLYRVYRLTPKAGAAAYERGDYRALFNIWNVLAIEIWSHR